MIASTLDNVIRGMCSELSISSVTRNWQDFNEEELLYEAAVCITSSQMIYEMALELADRLRLNGLLSPNVRPDTKWRRSVLRSLEKPIQFVVNGSLRTSRPRFKNRIAHLLAASLTRLYSGDGSIKELLINSVNPEHARRKLIDQICGFGPKQASLFLRRVGFSANLAVLDTHILDYMKIRTGTHTNVRALSKIDGYERIEEIFRGLANCIGYDIGRVDLATWITMRVAKRESYI